MISQIAISPLETVSKHSVHPNRFSLGSYNISKFYIRIITGQVYQTKRVTSTCLKHYPSGLRVGVAEYMNTLLNELGNTPRDPSITY